MRDTMATEQAGGSVQGWSLARIEVLGAEAEPLERFYGELLGWTPPGPGTAASTGVAGRVGRASAGQPACLTLVARVPDLDAAIRAVRARGGRLLERPRRTAEGRMATVADPAGNPIGLIGA